MVKDNSHIIEQLKKVSTATVATCLFKKGLRNQFIQNVRPLKKMTTTLVGQAYTLRYIPAREDLNPIEVFRDPKHLQRVAVEECPKGHVLVIDSRKDSRAASAGSILVTRLMKRGASGIVTDGGFRDSAEIAELDFPSFHQSPSAPTNLTLHQAIAINEPIGCGDVAVFPGDYIIGDDDGIMVVPSHLAEEVAKECLQMTLYEEFVMEKVKGGTAIIGLYPLTNEKIKEEFKDWLKEKDI
ncbi:ribonuclease activity regulator RraA [Flagellimonas hymeniacidonis]|uniref:Ribonuclease activity regulator RraA n=1 Tax=Flagellimonas hymeniacidonis TaxID=2603628 RepID=A0A5C8V128_9FLAO|nr:ribonuclease activity regulator RraA [Flagellimonas hymeniacidonis]TXN35224.1 ribonuclease activity regulator RraA [Flagellimonas hymeniacidonis]